MKNCFCKILSVRNANLKMDDFALLLLRVFVGLTMAFAHGLGKMPPPEQMISGLESMGFPAPLFFAWCAGLAEFLGGIFLALGLLTRPAAFFMMFTMGVAAFVAHAADPFNVKEMALLYMMIALFFVLFGAGRYSVDGFIFRKK